jgi:hypothetical protein
MALNSPNPAAIVVKGLMDEANQDGKQYARQDGEWSEVAPPSGKNLIINGNLTVDQRQGSDPDFIVDRWKVVDANNMTQIIEDVNFEPSTEYTLSWEGGTPQQITSPASGHWTLPNIPRTARKIQLEKGNQATEFEYEDYGTTLAKCFRYYYRLSSNKKYAKLTVPGWCNLPGGSYGVVGGGTAYPKILIPCQMRGYPALGHSAPLTDFIMNPSAHTNNTIVPTDIALEHDPENPLCFTLAVTANDLARGHFIDLNQRFDTPVWIELDAEL